MNQQTQRHATALTYTGVLPFLFLSIAVFTKLTGVDYSLAMRWYSVVIASFLCGTHWAANLFYPDQCQRNLLIASNAITLIVYASLFLAQHSIAFIVQSVCFIFLLLLDYELLKQHIIPSWYFNLRCNATVAVVAILLGVVCLA